MENLNNKKECLVFLSWQSDRKDCRNYVSSVVRNLSNSVSDLVAITVDRDTVNVPGAPDIGDTIFEKIDNCDLFIADITLINDKESGYRRTPNPNVMIELGYAIKSLGWERILLLQCEDYGDIEELPFDINHRRICNFSLGLSEETKEKRNKERENSKKSTIMRIRETIKLLLEKGILFGGRKGKIPKFEIKCCRALNSMMLLEFMIQNVSSVLVSGIQIEGPLQVVFKDGATKEVSCNPKLSDTALKSGDMTKLKLGNEMLGYGKGHNNAYWQNIDAVWQFSCEDEEGTKYWYEVSRHIDDAYKNMEAMGQWKVKYIG